MGSYSDPVSSSDDAPGNHLRGHTPEPIAVNGSPPVDPHLKDALRDHMDSEQSGKIEGGWLRMIFYPPGVTSKK